MKTKQLPTSWREVELGEVLDYEQPTKYIVENTDYRDEHQTPVLTAGKSFILGYTNETKGIYDKLPVIIFDDFTTENKFVDFKFKVKSSAMKLLRSKNNLISLKYVFLVMQTINFDMERHKRYYLSAYQSLKIPLPFSDGKPDLQAQKAIVSILEKAEQLKQRREKADKLTDEYLKSIFWEMFYNKGFEIKKLGEVTQKITDGKHGDCEDLDQSGYYFISAKDIIAGKVSYENARQIKKEGYFEVNKRVNLELDDILITNSGTIGRIAIMDNVEKVKRTTFQKSVAIIKLNKKVLTPLFARYFLETTKEKLMITSSGSSQKNLLLKDIKNFQIPLPPFPLQQKFANIVEKIEKMKEKQKQSSKEINNLFNVLMQKAFKGEMGK